MKTINTIISENIYNELSIAHIVNVCESVANNNGVKASLENNQIFIYGCEQKEVDAEEVREEMLKALIEEGF